MKYPRTLKSHIKNALKYFPVLILGEVQAILRQDMSFTWEGISCRLERICMPCRLGYCFETDIKAVARRRLQVARKN